MLYAHAIGGGREKGGMLTHTLEFKLREVFFPNRSMQRETLVLRYHAAAEEILDRVLRVADPHAGRAQDRAHALLSAGPLASLQIQIGASAELAGRANLACLFNHWPWSSYGVSRSKSRLSKQRPTRIH